MRVALVNWLNMHALQQPSILFGLAATKGCAEVARAPGS